MGAGTDVQKLNGIVNTIAVPGLSVRKHSHAVVAQWPGWYKLTLSRAVEELPPQGFQIDLSP